MPGHGGWLCQNCHNSQHQLSVQYTPKVQPSHPPLKLFRRCSRSRPAKQHTPGSAATFRLAEGGPFCTQMVLPFFSSEASAGTSGFSQLMWVQDTL